MSKSSALLIAAVMIVIGIGPAARAADAIELSAIERAARQIAGPVAREQAAGKAWRDANADAAFAELLRLIEQGDAVRQQRAAHAAGVLISPWLQAMESRNTHKGQIELFQVRRPVARPADHARAAGLRKAALQALEKLLTQRPVPPANDDNGKNPSFPGWADLNSIQSLCTLLAEVADADAADRVAALLAAEENRYLAGRLMRLLDTYHGRPISFHEGGMCGNSTPEEFRQFDIAENLRCKEAKASLLAWHRKHAAQPLAQRIEAALDLWDRDLTTSELAGYYTDSGQWITQTYLASMVRLGEPAVDALIKRALAAPKEKYWHRGAYEIALAAITGKADQTFVSRMLKGQTLEAYVGMEVIAAAGSKAFKEELTALTRTGHGYKKASYTLAVVYRAEAIPIFEKALSDDFVAACAIKELRAWGE